MGGAINTFYDIIRLRQPHEWMKSQHACENIQWVWLFVSFILFTLLRVLSFLSSFVYRHTLPMLIFVVVGAAVLLCYCAKHGEIYISIHNIRALCVCEKSIYVSLFEKPIAPPLCAQNIAVEWFCLAVSSTTIVCVQT